jgi:PAS domain S-box-containing protein
MARSTEYFHLKNLRKSLFFRGVILPGFGIFIIATIFLGFVCTKEIAFYTALSEHENKDVSSLITKRLQGSFIATGGVRAFFESGQQISKENFETVAKILGDETTSLGLHLTFEFIDENNTIRYIYPLNKENTAVIDQNVNTYPNRLEFINKAKETKKHVITEPLMLAQGYPGLLIFSPLFKNDVYLGSTVSVIKLSELTTLEEEYFNGKNIHIKTDNFILPFEKNSIYTQNKEIVTDPQGNTKKDGLMDTFFDSKDDTVSKIIFADKQWELHSYKNYTEMNKGMVVYTAAGYLAAMIVVYLLFVIHNRNKRIFLEKVRTEAFVSSIGEGFIATDKMGKVIYANEEAGKLSGYERKEMLGKLFTKVWHIVDEKGNPIPEKDRPCQKVLKGGKKIEIDTLSKIFLQKKDGQTIPITSSISPILDRSNKTEGIVIVVKDSTKEHEVDKMKTEFISLAAHQLLTPVTAIKLISEMFTSGYYGDLNNDDQKENMKSIHTLAGRMTGLIKSLLNISRIEAGRLTVDPRPTNLKNIINELFIELKNKIEERQHLVNIAIDENIKEINVDPQLIREVYKNFLTNAIKYTPRGGNISVMVTTQGENIVSKITDNGYGIPEIEKTKVFEKFYRGDNIIKIEKDGEGLGLYLVKQIVEISGGKVWFESEENKGTTFYFSLPLAGSKAKQGEVSFSTGA